MKKPKCVTCGKAIKDFNVLFYEKSYDISLISKNRILNTVSCTGSKFRSVTIWPSEAEIFCQRCINKKWRELKKQEEKILWKWRFEPEQCTRCGQFIECDEYILHCRRIYDYREESAEEEYWDSGPCGLAPIDPFERWVGGEKLAIEFDKPETYCERCVNEKYAELTELSASSRLNSIICDTYKKFYGKPLSLPL